MKILNFGSLNIDYVYAVDHLVKPGETETSDDMRVICGGKGLNQSIALSRAGASVFHAGNIGAGDGRILREKLASCGVDVSYIREHNCASGHAIIQVDKAGQNCIVLYGGANRRVTKEQVDAVLGGLAEGDLILLQNEINELAYIVGEAHRRHIQIALNPSPMNDAILELPLDKIDFLFLNEVEAAAILGGGADPEAAKKIAARFPRCTVILTRGGDGVEAVREGRYYRRGAYRVPVVDTTAAGDTFTGFFLASYFNGNDMDASLELASRAAAICVGRKGASESIPTMAEVMNTQFE